MDSQRPDYPQKRKFLFSVDIMIEERSNGRALEALLHLLNSQPIEDYDIKQGIALGEKIDTALQDAIMKQNQEKAAHIAQTTSEPQAAGSGSAGKDGSKKSKAAVTETNPYLEIWDKLKSFQNSGTLIRLTVIKGKGIKLSIPCRIISTDPASDNVTVYHVDEKKVYLLKINEIDDFEA
ncbi:hypothetical protein ACFQI7_17510 [Paenibacillus allorhizosphaerae]|uniref:DUF2642 domain-containing protein n=1 Tax=Paenibacillus allorhizosphaerae TaxID=2849866 RepID=A0ABM8VEL9_9BACL|nr:hypothetical protein [Paenibacillus allorhizosphaerae]CAG7631798.1 hypothetical protein PAECIP111802_01781 [Paenibacillus allorhizosphaerae]